MTELLAIIGIPYARSRHPHKFRPYVLFGKVVSPNTLEHAYAEVDWNTL